MRRIFWTQTLICLIFALWQSHRCDVANSGHFVFLGDVAKLAITIADTDRFYWNLVIGMPFDVALLLRNFVKILHCLWKLWTCIQRFTFFPDSVYSSHLIRFYPTVNATFGFVISCCLSVTWLYWDKTTEARITRFPLNCISMPQLFSRTLQFHCNVRLFSWYVACRLSVVCRSSSVTRVYCDKTTEVKITQFSHKSIVRSYF